MTGTWSDSQERRGDVSTQWMVRLLFSLALFFFITVLGDLFCY